MELEARITELAKTVREHREVLLTEEAAKTALVMPFLQALGYNIFNPSEVIPEYTCDVGIKKGEKVDYAISDNGKIRILIECKPANSELNINHASQLFRYFSTTDARIAILTNGVIYQFYSDIDMPNKMDNKPFFSIKIDSIRKVDLRTLENFTKQAFDIDKIVQEAGTLKMQSLVYKALQEEFRDPSDEFVRLIATKVREGRMTSNVKDAFKSLIVNSVSSFVRDKVNERLTSALTASNPSEETDVGQEDEAGISTTQEEIDGYNIVRAIASRAVDPKRVVMRDAKSYCAILLDDNNRRTIARLYFNSQTARYLGTFIGKDEIRIAVGDPIDIFQHEAAVLNRIQELIAKNDH
ncbi:MAG: type I restriction enzyme HsdR N-terminal domain-containing protein [Proteobacteria bacterium]|nr:type I restriction enzyme HsdR N-terminal domain-containing protein [Pseudomonadota bacterium]